jgi:hypothetical protein
MIRQSSGSRQPSASTYAKGILTGWVLGYVMVTLVALARGYSLSESAPAVVVASGMMSAGLSSLLVRRLSHLQGNADPRPTATIELSMTDEVCFSLCLAAISSLPNWVLFSADRARGEIMARVSDSMGPFGQRVRLKLRSQGDRVSIDMSSRSRQPMLLFDYGSSERNLEQLIAELRRVSRDEWRG